MKVIQKIRATGGSKEETQDGAMSRAALRNGGRKKARRRINKKIRQAVKSGKLD